jgi:hypothetical protein
MELFIAITAFALLAIWLIVRAKPVRNTSKLDPSETNMTLDLLLEESEKTNELLRQLIRAYGHEPEA